MQKLLTFFSKNISIYAIFNDQSFNDTLTIDIVNFEQLGPDLSKIRGFRIGTFVHRIQDNYGIYIYTHTNLRVCTGCRSTLIFHTPISTNGSIQSQRQAIPSMNLRGKKAFSSERPVGIHMVIVGFTAFFLYAGLYKPTYGTKDLMVTGM